MARNPRVRLAGHLCGLSIDLDWDHDARLDELHRVRMHGELDDGLVGLRDTHVLHPEVRGSVGLQAASHKRTDACTLRTSMGVAVAG